MFKVEELVKATGGRLVSGNPKLIVRGVSIDSRTIKTEEIFIAIRGDRFDGHSFIQEAIRKRARAIILCRRFSNKLKKIVRNSNRKVSFIAVSDTRKALGRLACFHRSRFSIPIIAITGSNGKTTVKDMLAWVLSSQARVLKNPGTQNNDIGLPLTLLKLDISHDVVVLELGTNHFGEIAYLADISGPNLGIITNIGLSHLEYLKNLSGVYKEKVSLLKELRLPKIAILNADDSKLAGLRNNKKIFKATFGIKNKCDFKASSIRVTANNKLEFLVNANLSCKVRLNTIGYANVYNALAVITAARLLGFRYGSINQRLGSFIFPPGRLRLIKLNSISFLDDTYNANPNSLSEALSVLSRVKIKGRRILVLGDMLELGDFLYTECFI